MPTATINGTSIYYEEEGVGAPCLVLHGGLGVDHTLYRTLAPLGDRLRLILYDHRGNGRSGRPPIESLTIEQLADDAAGLADHLGLDRFLVLGHSYGGFVAQELAIRQEGRVRALLLVGTTPGQLGTGETEEEASGPPQPAEFVELMSTPPTTDAEFAGSMRAMFRFYLHRLDPKALEPLLAATIFNVAAMEQGMAALGRWSAIDRLKAVTAPTLVAVGQHDLFCSPSQSYRIARHLPGAEVVLFDESGHFPWLDEPERFFEVVISWLARVGC
jgi:proline iminopeptidase